MSKNIQKAVLIPFIITVFLGLMASPLLSAEFTVKYGTPDPATGSTSMGAKWFLEEVKKRSKGRIEGRVFPASQLGNNIARIEQLQLGTLEFTGGAVAFMSGAYPPVTIFDLTVGGGAESATATVNADLTAGEDIVVLSNGTLVLNRPCTVSNGVYLLEGGVLTHSVNADTEANKIDVTVLGSMGHDRNTGGELDDTLYGGEDNDIAFASQSGSDVVIPLPDGTLTLRGLELSDLSVGDFMFIASRLPSRLGARLRFHFITGDSYGHTDFCNSFVRHGSR